MLSILHISDLHFGPPFVPAAAEALLRQAPALECDLIVASGDFTQRAKPPEFADARAFLDKLPPVPLVVVPGNHDVPLFRVAERLLAPYRNYQQTISQELDSVLRIDGAVIVALNSTAPYRTIDAGRIRPWQLDYAAEAFRSAHEGAVKIVVAHHHFCPAPDFDKHNNGPMPQARRALDRFTELGVDLIMGGHLHRAYIGNSLDVYPSKDRTSGIIIAQCGTTTSQRGRGKEREKNTFNVIKIGDDVVRITHYMYFHEVGGFAPVGRHIFPRRRHHYFTEPHLHD
jgi:3',5'-cyclic AMP phosphodiesterase CpdA